MERAQMWNGSVGCGRSVDTAALRSKWTAGIADCRLQRGGPCV